MIKYYLTTKGRGKNKPRSVFELWDINDLGLAYFNLKWKRRKGRGGREDAGFRWHMRYHMKAGYHISIL